MRWVCKDHQKGHLDVIGLLHTGVDVDTDTVPLFAALAQTASECVALAGEGMRHFYNRLWTPKSIRTP